MEIYFNKIKKYVLLFIINNNDLLPLNINNFYLQCIIIRNNKNY